MVNFEDKILLETKCWVEEIVIGLNLCPFAKRELDRDRVRFVISSAKSPEQLLLNLIDEITCLKENINIETTLLIHPQLLEDFLEYNDFLDIVDMLLQEHNFNQDFQVASFHPEYQFAHLETEEVGNYTNRSPYPMLHILRESSLDQAIDSHPDVHSIPIRNEKVMSEVGLAQIKSILTKCMKS